MRLADLRSLAIIAMTLITIAPAAADENDAQLRRGLLGFFRGAETLRIDAVPDLYEGGYARISVYAKRARLAEGGLLVDEAWVRLRGVTLSVPHFREGTFRVVSVRDAAIYLRISVRSLEQYFIAGNPWDDIRLWSEGGYLFARGTVPVIGIPTRVDMKGYFTVEGTHEIFFYVESLRVNWLPLRVPPAEHGAAVQPGHRPEDMAGDYQAPLDPAVEGGSGGYERAGSGGLRFLRSHRFLGSPMTPPRSP